MNPAAPPHPSVLTIGTFDGVHAGHRVLVRRAREIAEANPGSRVIALVFDPNPLEILRPEAAPERLSSFQQREQWLKEAGADEVVRLEPTQALLSESPEDFVSRCIVQYRPILFVEGDDFRFGKARAGTPAVLADLGKSRGFTCEIVPPVSIALTDHQLVPARSTIIRWLLSNGRTRDAAIVLGRPYELEGVVISGDRRGRTIGFPTANMQVSTMIPADGIYAAAATLPDGRELAAALSIGTKPTFGESARTVEAFLLRPDRRGSRWAPVDGFSEYGWLLRLRLLAWVREQVKFHSLEALLDQMERDCDRCEELVHSFEGPGAVSSGPLGDLSPTAKGAIA